MSPLGEYRPALHAVCELAAHPVTAQLLAHHPNWSPNSYDGRGLENESILGPFFKISTVMDIFGNGQPSVVDTCFSDPQTRRQAEVRSPFVFFLHVFIDVEIKRGNSSKPKEKAKKANEKSEKAKQGK